MPLSHTTQLARSGRNGDTEVGHLSRRDIVIPVERQTPEHRKALREMFGDDLERFTVGSAWNSVNPKTGLAEFADKDTDQQSDLGNAIAPVAGPSGSLTETAAGPPHGQQDPWQDIFKNVVSGMQPVAAEGATAGADSVGGGAARAIADPGGGEGVGAGASGHDSGGARGPGAGARGAPGFARDAIDALMGLAMGAIGGPLAGIATTAARTALDPSYDPTSILGSPGLLGRGDGSGVQSGGGADPGGGTSGTVGGEHGAEKGAATGTDASGLGLGGGGLGAGSADHGSTGEGTGAAGGLT